MSGKAETRSESCGGRVPVVFNVLSVTWPEPGKGPDSRMFGLHVQSTVLLPLFGRWEMSAYRTSGHFFFCLSFFFLGDLDIFILPSSDIHN